MLALADTQVEPAAKVRSIITGQSSLKDKNLPSRFGELVAGEFSVSCREMRLKLLVW
jgi:hypothetical protein